MMDVSGGVFRVRKWPAGRPTRPTLAQKEQRDKFRVAQRMIAYMDPRMQMQVRDAVNGTALLPRDLLTSMIYGRLAYLIRSDGVKIFPMAFRTDVSESLDALSQVIGTMLIRGPQFWEALAPGEEGDVLQWQADGKPVWVPGGGISGGTGFDCAGANQSVPNNNFAAGYINWAAPRHSDPGYFDIAQPTRIVAPSIGFYTASFQVLWDASTVGNRWMFIHCSDGRHWAEVQNAPTASTRQQIAATMYLQANDYIRLQLAQTRGSALNATNLQAGFAKN